MLNHKIIALAAVAAFSATAAPAFAQTIDGTPRSLVPTSESDNHTFAPGTRNNAVVLQTVSPSAYLPVLENNDPALRQIEQATQRNRPAVPARPAPATNSVSIMTGG
jgi:hypothetical protein